MYFQSWSSWEHISWGFDTATRSNRIPSIRQMLLPSFSRVSKTWTYRRLKMKVVISFETSGSVYLVTQLLAAEELNSRLHRCVNLITHSTCQLCVKDRYLTHKFGISFPVNGGGYRRLHCAFRFTIFRIRFMGHFFSQTVRRVPESAGWWVRIRKNCPVSK